MCVEATAKGLLTDGEFKAASWDWVQDTTTATSKWGDIGDWDVSGVKDFSYAFSTHRDVVGGTFANDDGNPKAKTHFVAVNPAAFVRIRCGILYDPRLELQLG